MKLKIGILSLSLILAAAGAACGSDEDFVDGLGGGGGNNRAEERDAGDGGPTDATDGDADSSSEGPSDAGDAGDADGDSGDAGEVDGGGDECDEEGDCGGERVCHEGQCVEETAEITCERAEDLGTLTTSESLTIEDSFEGGAETLETTCSTETGPEKVYRFRVDEDSLVSHQTSFDGQIDAKLEFRTECTEQAADERCFDADGSVFAPADSELWLVVERDVGRAGGFAIELEATAESCPMGARRCDDGELEVCRGGSESNTYDCAEGCVDDSRCAGDVCSEAIDVTASTTFSGNLGAYSNQIDFDGEGLCALADGTTVPTPGNELVFRFPELAENQVIHIDLETDDPNTNALFVLDSCQSEPYACEYVNADEEKGDWKVAEAGTYYIVVDKLTGGVNDYRYAFEYK